MTEAVLSSVERSAVVRRCLGRVGLLAGGSILLYLFAFEVLDPPATYSCGGDPPPEAADERADFLPPALAATAAWAVALSYLAWTWAAERMEAVGRPARPGKLAGWMAAVALVAWGALFGDVIEGDRTGGAVFYGALLGALGVAILAAVALGLALHLTIVRPSGERWVRNADSLTTGAAWTLLLSLLPAFTVMVSVRGTDTTIFC